MPSPAVSAQYEFIKKHVYKTTTLVPHIYEHAQHDYFMARKHDSVVTVLYLAGMAGDTSTADAASFQMWCRQLRPSLAPRQNLQ